MKPFEKDAPRQARREKALTRLEATLKGGVKILVTKRESKVRGKIKIIKTFGTVKVPFEKVDIDRINREIATLKTRLGKV